VSPTNCGTSFLRSSWLGYDFFESGASLPFPFAPELAGTSFARLPIDDTVGWIARGLILFLRVGALDLLFKLGQTLILVHVYTVHLE
jgi:hypothetical protein